MTPRVFSVFVVCACLNLPVYAADYQVEVTGEGPPSAELSESITAQLSSTGLKVIGGSSRTVCELWLCKQWEVAANFQPTSEVLYPFKAGQLIGVARFSRKGGDFRDQDIDEGVYTLRYAQQPVDGAHVGTSPTRDFLLLVRAEDDQSVDLMDEKRLNEVSAAAAQSSHPAMLCLQPVRGGVGSEPSLQEDEQNGWWIAMFQGNTKAGNATAKLSVALVVVGVAAE